METLAEICERVRLKIREYFAECKQHHVEPDYNFVKKFYRRAVRQLSQNSPCDPYPLTFFP